jgi:Flp pilus assembly protein CpaB
MLNPRTLLGALLVCASGVGLYVAASDDGSDTGRAVVVARRDLRPGEELEAGDLRVERGQLPPSADGFTAVEDLLGRVVLGPVGSGEIIQEATVTSDRAVGAAQREVAVTLPREQVAVGRLRVGDRVDLFVTYEEQTAVVVRGASVVLIGAADDDVLAADREVRLVVALESDEAVTALVHALRTGDVTVVRSTLAGEEAGDATSSTVSDPDASSVEGPDER